MFELFGVLLGLPVFLSRLVYWGGGGVLALGSFDGSVGVSCTVLSLYILAFRLTLTCSSVRLFHCTNTYILHFVFFCLYRID